MITYSSPRHYIKVAKMWLSKYAKAWLKVERPIKIKFIAMGKIIGKIDFTWLSTITLAKVSNNEALCCSATIDLDQVKRVLIILQERKKKKHWKDSNNTLIKKGYTVCILNGFFQNSCFWKTSFYFQNIVFHLTCLKHYNQEVMCNVNPAL